MKKVLLAGGAVFLLGAGALVVRERGRDETPEGSPTVAAAERRTIEVSAEAAGLVEPSRVVEVKSKASGEVFRVLAETGDRVEPGTLLAEIDPRDVQNALDQAAADLESARVRRATVRAERDRMKRLRDAGLIPQQDYERTIDTAAAAQADLVRAETNLRLARERRGDTTIRAPGAGTIIERTVEQGQIVASATSNVSGGSTLFRMADLARMQVRANVDETDIGKVHPGQRAEVTVEAYPGRTFVGEVLKIEPQAVVEQNVTMFPVLVGLDNPEGLLMPGMNAEVTVAIARRTGVVAVPNAAVVSMRDAGSVAEVLGLDAEAARTAMRSRGADRSGQNGRNGAADGPATEDVETRPGVVFVQGEQGPEPRRVTLGLSDWDFTEVVRGLDAGEEVVLVSVAQLQQRQQEQADRMRRRAGGLLPGTGGNQRNGSRRTGG